jgi:hypothetical protein
MTFAMKLGEPMNEQRRLRVVQLATAESRARRRWETLGLYGTATLSPAEREELDIEYALARADWAEA